MTSYTHHKKLLPIVKWLALSLSWIWFFNGVVASASPIQDDKGITILLYHRVGEEQKHPSTSVSLEQFQAHLDYLIAKNYEVLHLDRLLKDIAEGRTFPHKKIAITFDDGFQSIARHAFEELQSRSLPFTVFINSGVHEEGGQDFMTWETMKNLAKSHLVKFESHSYTHASLLGLSDSAITNAVEKDMHLIEEKLGQKPTLFSYPYGEIDTDQQQRIKTAGFLAAVGQHSGVAHALADPYFQARFSMNYRYGSIDRLQTALKATPLAIHQVFPTTRRITQAHKHIVLEAGIPLHKNFQCFGNGKKLQHALSKNQTRTVVHIPSDAFQERRFRINCTMPHEKEKGFFRWKGLVFFGKQ